MIDRRDFLGMAAGAGASLALTPQLLRALQTLQQPSAKLIQRAIPSTGEKLPVIGLGFANHAGCADPAALKAVLETFADNGGRVFDTTHGNASNSEQLHATLANELGIQNKLFLGLKAVPVGSQPRNPNPAGAKAQIESLFAKFEVPKLDLVQVPVSADQSYWDVVKEAKKAGRIRYLGAAGTTFTAYPQFESVVRNQPIDFISVDYSIGSRAAEEKILPLALERKLAVLTFFSFGGADGLSCAGGKGLFERVANTPLPEWAAAFDAETWAQFFLKYVISHPAVTVARVGTTKPHHMLDNLAGGTGRLPDEATRKRMAAFVDALPKSAPPPPPTSLPAVALPAAVLDRYVGQYKAESGFTATFRRDGETLYAKLGTDPEVPLVARSQTRFTPPDGALVEFRAAAAGALSTRAILVRQGSPAIQLARVP